MVTSIQNQRNIGGQFESIVSRWNDILLRCANISLHGLGAIIYATDAAFVHQMSETVRTEQGDRHMSIQYNNAKLHDRSRSYPQ